MIELRVCLENNRMLFFYRENIKQILFHKLTNKRIASKNANYEEIR